MRKTYLIALACSVALLASSGFARAGWNHDYTDPSNDVSNADIDITALRSYVDGTDVVMQMTVRGSIASSVYVMYWIYVESESSGIYLYWTNGFGRMYYQGGYLTSNISASGNTLSGRLPRVDAGAEASFDIIGYAVSSAGTGSGADWAGAGYTGGPSGTGDVGEILGMALWVFALLLIIPIVVVVLIIVLLLMQKPHAPPPAQQPPYPQQYPQYPQQYPGQYPQQAPPQSPPQQYPPQPPQQGPPKQPGQ